MNLFNFIRSKVEKRSHVSPISTHDLLIGRAVESEAGTIVNPLLAENLSAVFGCIQIIAETVASLPLQVYRRDGEDRRTRSDTHPIARLFSSDVNDRQTAFEWFEMMTAHCLLRGNAYAEIIRDNRGAVIALKPLHPNSVSVVESLRTGRILYDVTDPNGGTRRLLPEEVLHLKDRSDDGIIGVSRLRRAREAFGTASATERFAASTYRNGAYLSGVVKHPDEIGPEAAQTIRESMAALHSGTGNAGRFAVLEEGMDWQAISVSPEDAQMLESRRFSVEQIARIYRIPPPVLGDLSNGSYSNVTELGRWFAGMTIRPWLDRWEQALSRALLTEEGRRSHVLEFDMDLLMRGDMLARLQAYRIGREIGLYNANDLRRFENLNPRADDEAETYLSPLNMQPEQTRAPKEGSA
ncbi:phage portal protein [Aureimonas altamirensis]|uniref:phage portal protein n=1 Tax=Aureimonas altamirensis TaxID=370622 RepID=UPI001E5F4E7E|nr:phage portal protein [Aureimonas altamirensis]UHD44159.1 phage portal protein [Aureimonas altamirensis]